MNTNVTIRDVAKMWLEPEALQNAPLLSVKRDGRTILVILHAQPHSVPPSITDPYCNDNDRRTKFFVQLLLYVSGIIGEAVSLCSECPLAQVLITASL